MPLEQLRVDFLLLKRLGFSMIKIQEVWAFDERREGEIDLSTVTQLVADARQNGLKVYFGVTMETAPAWLWQKYPDASMVYETGQPHNDPTQYVPIADGKPGPCWHHPGAREAGVRFIEAVGREIGKYDNILVWNVWQEIDFWPMRSGHLGFCYCQYTLAEFRKWLRARYPTIEALNNTWQSAYGDWNQIEPPRFSANVPPSIDWRYFMDDVYLADALRWKAEAFRRSDPQRRPILAHVAEPTIGSTRDWRYAEVLDVFGSSEYPAWVSLDKWDAELPPAGKPVPKFAGLYRELWESILLRLDYVRSASHRGEFWTAELQGGPIATQMMLGRVPGPADIRRWVLGCLAAGARGICFWNQRPAYFWGLDDGFSLLESRGDRSPRAEEAGRLARGIDAHAELFTKGEVARPEVAMVMDEDLWHFVEGSSSNLRSHLAYSIRGIYRSLWEEGIPVEFIDAEQIPANATEYKALIFPLPIALSDKVIKALQGYVRSGGRLMSEAFPGRFSQYGFGYPGEMAAGIEDLFGAAHKRLLVIGEPNDGAKWTASGRTYGDIVEYRELAGVGDFAKHSVFPAFYLQTLLPSTARPVLMFGDEVVGCVNSYGQGRAYLVGTLLGHALPAYHDARNAKLLAAVLAGAGVTPDKVGRLQRRRRALGNKTAWFLFNTTTDTVEETVSVHGFRSVKDLLEPDLTVTGGGCGSAWSRWKCGVWCWNADFPSATPENYGLWQTHLKARISKRCFISRERSTVWAGEFLGDHSIC